MWSRRSITSGLRPAAARRSARIEPAKPAPTTSTSASGSGRVNRRIRQSPSGCSHASPAEQVRNRADEDLDVAPEGPVGDVEVVDLHHLIERDPGGPEDLPLP